ncbi:hypothetical protein MBLNU230_g4205t1 [Neophaeotheca triangularis]
MKRLKRKLTKKSTDTPWMSSMTSHYDTSPDSAGQNRENAASSNVQPTVAGFAPNLQHMSSKNSSTASVLIHQKSPLLIATPPQVTRALAYSHPFILPLNRLVGLLSWTTDDPWESFLLLIWFWLTVLYGDPVIRWGGPVVMVAGIMLGMYTRRYSPLSSTAWTGDKKHKRGNSDTETQRKSLDEILDTLKTFTSRCNILLDPLLRLTDFLSTQTTATIATTRPALTTLFLRILLFTPIWIALTLPPFYILTTQRVFLALGTTVLSWHSRPARVVRTILWRSRTIRTIASAITGFTFPSPSEASATSTSSQTKRPNLPPRTQNSTSSLTTTNTSSNNPSSVRFTFTLYENQRRWIGLGWTYSLFSYERQAWTDEHLNTTEPPETFQLPETDNDTTVWRWAPSSEWRVEGAAREKEKSAKRIGGGGGGEEDGWTYFDNKWQDGHRKDGWGRYTRRRKWGRDAELIELESGDVGTAGDARGRGSSVASGMEGNSPRPSPRKRAGWFSGGGGGGGGSLSSGGGGKGKRRLTGEQQEASAPPADSFVSGHSEGGSSSKSRHRDGPDEDVHTPIRYREREWEREIGEGVAEGLG